MALERHEVKNPIGLNTDLAPADLPLTEWSSGNNIRFKNGKAQKALGHQTIFDSDFSVLSLFPYIKNNIPYWLLATKDKIYAADGTVILDVSPGQTFHADESNNWIGSSLNGAIIMNNPVDGPYAMTPEVGSFIPLPNWPANTQARVIRPYKNYLIALNITKNSVEMPQLVKWSSPADPGGVPGTWDETDPRNDAGENPLADTNGKIVDGKKLRDAFIIYKEDSVYSMRFIGGVYVFQFQQLFDDIGMLGPNCAVEFDGKHFVVGQGDIYVHNGVEKKSVIDGKMRKFFFNDINADNYKKTFVVSDTVNTEMWVCYSSTKMTEGQFCDKAIVWNWSENTWSLRDMPNVIAGDYGIIDPKESNLWDDDVEIWDVDTTVWGAGTYNPSKRKLIFTSNVDKKMYLFGESATFSGQTFQSFLERTDMYLGEDRMMKTMSSVIPHITGNGSCNVFVGASAVQGGAIRWKGPIPFNIGTDYKIDCKHVGRYIALRFEFDSYGDWAFNGYTAEYAPNAGMR